MVSQVRVKVNWKGQKRENITKTWKEYVFICTIFFHVLFYGVHAFGSSAPMRTECDAIELFKEKDYRKIIEYLHKVKLSNECEKLLLAKSYERLGLYSRSIKILRVMYNDNSPLRDYVAFFIANNYERLNDFSNALQWYKNILMKSQNTNLDYGETVDRFAIFTAAQKRIVSLGTRKKNDFHDVERLLKKLSKNSIHSTYFTALLYHGAHRYRDAAEHYTLLLKDENKIYQKHALEHISNDRKLIQIMGEYGISKTDLIHLCIKNAHYEGALFISYLIPYSMYVAQLRAYCYYKIGDYQTAAVLYNEYYAHYKDTEALVKIAFSYFYLGKKGQSYLYLQKYLEKKESPKSISADAYYLRLILNRDKSNIQKYLEESEYFVKKYSRYAGIDGFIHDTFYFTLLGGHRDFAVGFLKNTYIHIRDTHYRAWASYILGIYDDDSFLEGAIIHFPGSYYYYVAAEKRSINSNLVKTADNLFNQNKLEEALNEYILLYAGGIQRKYVESKIVEILSRVPSYDYLFQIEQIRVGNHRSTLFDLYRYGLYEELQNIIDPDFIIGQTKEKAYYYYLLSKTAYELKDITKGISYGEKVLSLTNRKYSLFLPQDIVKLCYPYVYSDIIVSKLGSSATYMNPCFILSVIRVESRYNAEAKSPRGALGLMQILPGTGGWIKNSTLSTRELLDPSLNIEIGIKFLNHLNEKFGSTILALAAYNGGPKNVERWIEKNSNENELIFLEEIPFAETRNFVKMVISTYEIYKSIYRTNCYAY